MVVFTNPGFVVQTLCFKSHLAFFACMVGEGIYICVCVLFGLKGQQNGCKTPANKCGSAQRGSPLKCVNITRYHKIIMPCRANNRFEKRETSKLSAGAQVLKKSFRPVATDHDFPRDVAGVNDLDTLW